MTQWIALHEAISHQSQWESLCFLTSHCLPGVLKFFPFLPDECGPFTEAVSSLSLCLALSGRLPLVASSFVSKCPTRHSHHQPPRSHYCTACSKDVIQASTPATNPPLLFICLFNEFSIHLHACNTIKRDGVAFVNIDWIELIWCVLLKCSLVGVKIKNE